MPAKPILKPLAPTPVPLQHRVLPPVAPVPDETVPATRALAKAAKKAVKKAATAKSAADSRKQKALSVTQAILKNLAILQKAFLRVVMLLGQVRDEKLYAELGHATIEAYAAAELKLKRSALAMYLRVYDWLRKNHPDLLKPGAKVKLADLQDAIDLIWIEEELTRESLPADKKAALQDLQRKALDGTLRRSEVRAYKASGNNKITDGNRAFLSKLRRLREYGAALAGLPEGVIGHLEAAIDILNGAVGDAKKKGVKKIAKRPTAGF